jgi:hypothetical protein
MQGYAAQRRDLEPGLALESSSQAATLPG